RATPAPTSHPHAVGPHAGTPLGPVDGCLEVAQGLRPWLPENDLEDRLDVRQLRHAALALEEFRSDRVVALLGEAARGVADVLVHSEDLRDDENDGVTASRGGSRLVDRQGVVADLYLGVAGHDTRGVRLDRLGQHGVRGETVARDSPAADL